MPDLAPAVPGLPAFVSVGQAVTVVGVVTNQGNGGGLGYWYDGIYLSTNTVLSASDQPLAMAQISRENGGPGVVVGGRLQPIDRF